MLYRLFNFPTAKSQPAARQRWLTAINRADPNKPYALLQPGSKSRVCSKHFVDGRPSAEHPDPELMLGTGNVPKQRKTRAGHIIRATSASDTGSSSSCKVDMLNGSSAVQPHVTAPSGFTFV